MFILVARDHEFSNQTPQVVNNLCLTPFLFLSATCSNVHAMHCPVALFHVVTLDLASPYA